MSEGYEVPLSYRGDRPTNDLIVVHLLGIHFILFIYLVKKKTTTRYRDSNSRPNASEGYEPNELIPGKKKEIEITTEKKKKKNI